MSRKNNGGSGIQAKPSDTIAEEADSRYLSTAPNESIFVPAALGACGKRMNRQFVIGFAVKLGLAAMILIDSARADDPASFFESKVRPVLAAHCYKCHKTAKKGEIGRASCRQRV